VPLLCAGVTKRMEKSDARYRSVIDMRTLEG
jgi:hypothetical protein